MTQLTNEQEFDLQAQFKTALGNPAPVTEVKWTSSDEAVAKANVDANDPTKVVVSAVGPGTAVITVEAKNSKGTVIDGAYNVVVEEAGAVLVIFLAGEPRSKVV